MTRIYLFSPIPYTFLYQRPQTIADHLVRYGIPVVFIEPCGLTEYLKGRRKGLMRLVLSSIGYQALGIFSFLLPREPAGADRRAGNTHPAAATLSIVTMPMVYPTRRADSPLLERFNAVVLRQALRRRVLRSIGQNEQAIAIVQNPFWGLVLRREDFTLVAYDCLDEISIFAGRASTGRFARYELSLINAAATLFVTAEKLETRLRAIAPTKSIYRVPNGVDYEWFQERAARQGPPSDLKGTQHPIAGYVGVLHDWFDFELLGQLARSMPDVTFVIVGPIGVLSRTARLRLLPNVHWTGRREHAEIPRYISTFDVCIIPFLPVSISQTTNPVKVFEYFALGKPVVSTPMRELDRFGEEGLLRIAHGREEFASAIRDSIAEPAGELRERRREVARQHSWRVLTDRILTGLNLGTRQ